MSEILPRAGIVMGSDSDWPTMKEAADLLAGLELPYEKRVVSAHRTPDLMAEYGKNARERGIEVIIAGAGGAAQRPEMVASSTKPPVIGRTRHTAHPGGV